MSLLCALGRHRARPMARWNAGYYFTTCARCGEDLVRTAFESWHTVPRGFRVVWSPEPPPRTRGAALVADAALRSERDADALEPMLPLGAAKPSEIDSAARDGDLPIGEVLRLLREDDEQASARPTPERGLSPLAEAKERGHADEPLELVHTEAASLENPAEGPASGSPAAAPHADRGDDFMDEARDRAFWHGAEDGAASQAPEVGGEVTAGAPALGDAAGEPENREPETDAAELPASAEMAALVEHGAEHEAGPAADRPAQREAELTSGDAPLPVPAPAPTPAAPVRRDRAAWPSAAPSHARPPIVAMEGGSASSLPFGLAIAGAVVVAVAALLLVLYIHPAPSGPAERQRRAATAAAAPAAVGQPAYVTVGRLSCRASSVLQAPTVRVLLRGQQVAVLAREPGWASVIKDGRQCWVVDRYLSSVAPL